MDAINDKDNTTEAIASIDTVEHKAIDDLQRAMHPKLYQLAYPFVCGVCKVVCETPTKLLEHQQKVGCAYEIDASSKPAENGDVPEIVV